MDETTLQQLEQVKDFLGKINGNYVTKEDFVKAFKIIRETLIDMRKSNEKIIKESGNKSLDFTEEIKTLEKNINSISFDLESKISNKSLEVNKMLTKEIKRLEGMIPDIKPVEAKIEASVGQLEAKIPKLPEEIKAGQVRDKLETLKDDERLDKSAIKGLDEEFKKMDTKISSSSRGGGGGGRAMRGSSFSFSGNGSTTTFYLPTEVAGRGMFIFAHYQGQWLQKDVHYSLSGKTFNTLGGTATFTAATGTVIEGFIINL